MRFKKFLCYLLCGILTFGVISTANYKSAHAMEWVSGALSFAETLTWVLASLGITCTVSDYATEVDKSRTEFWEEYETDFYDYVNDHQGNTASDRFISWKNKLCSGVLDKSSEYWSLFKSWASELVNGSSSGGGTTAFNIPLNGTISDCIQSVNSFFGTSISFSNNNNVVVNYMILGFYNNNITDIYFISGNNVGLQLDGGSLYVTGQRTQYYKSINSNLGTFSLSSWSGSNRLSIGASGGYVNYITDNFSNLDTVIDNITGYNYIGIGETSSGATDSNFDGAVTNVDDLDVISSDGVDEDSPEVTLPYPGVSDSDDTISTDAYQDIIDAINDGTITQEDGVIEIQKILKIITYDTVTDDVVPPIKDDDGNNKKKDEVLQENKDNMTFTLGGLEAVFPFCIPFDIYAFMTLLVAEPECPEFDFPIKSVNGQVEEIHIDLEPFESVAVVVRYCFDFLFIIGLAMLTRSLIGGGSSD